MLFYARTSGPSRRAQAFLAQVLQRRGNHDTFDIHLIPQEDCPDLFERFSVADEPTLVIVDQGDVTARLQPKWGVKDVETFLTPWLQ